MFSFHFDISTILLQPFSIPTFLFKLSTRFPITDELKISFALFSKKKLFFI